MANDKNDSANRGNAGWGEVKKGYATDAGVVPPISPGQGSSSSSSSQGGSTPSDNGSSTSTTSNQK